MKDQQIQVRLLQDIREVRELSRGDVFADDYTIEDEHLVEGVLSR